MIHGPRTDDSASYYGIRRRHYFCGLTDHRGRVLQPSASTSARGAGQGEEGTKADLHSRECDLEGLLRLRDGARGVLVGGVPAEAQQPQRQARPQHQQIRHLQQRKKLINLIKEEGEPKIQRHGGPLSLDIGCSDDLAKRWRQGVASNFNWFFLPLPKHVASKRHWCCHESMLGVYRSFMQSPSAHRLVELVLEVRVLLGLAVVGPRKGQQEAYQVGRDAHPRLDIVVSPAGATHRYEVRIIVMMILL
jgi:hypothetical protein